MPMAVGMIQTNGFPGVLAAADAMVKSGRVALVSFDKAERGEFFVAIRGPISEVKRSMAAGIAAAEASYGGKVVTHYTIPNPPENLEAVLPIDYTEASEPFRVPALS